MDLSHPKRLGNKKRSQRSGSAINMTIKMYGADWCGDCVRAKKYFADHQVEYQWVDLERDENEKFVESEVLRRNNGKKSIPVIVFDDGSHLTEPTNAQLAEKLGLPS